MRKKAIIVSLLTSILSGCLVQFIPEADEGKEYLVVEGMVTNQNRIYNITISKTSGLGQQNTITGVTGAGVYVMDDIGNNYMFSEKKQGLYQSDSLIFTGIPGRKYSLRMNISGQNYESDFMTMNPVPGIDSIDARLEYNTSYSLGKPVAGYRVYISTGDETGLCMYYKWDYSETWEFRIPYIYTTILNRICWKSARSERIFLKNASTLDKNRIASFPLNFISTETDRLKVRYSVQVNQYSINQDEYLYWEKIKKVSESVGGLYDVVPSSIRGNIICTDDPQEKVLGFFSVSSVTSERLFIRNELIDFPDFYGKCPLDTVPAGKPIQGLGTFFFIIARLNDHPPTFGTFYVLTDKKECIDCTLEGSNVMPPFWTETGKKTILHNLYREN